MQSIGKIRPAECCWVVQKCSSPHLALWVIVLRAVHLKLRKLIFTVDWKNKLNNLMHIYWSWKCLETAFTFISMAVGRIVGIILSKLSMSCDYSLRGHGQIISWQHWLADALSSKLFTSNIHEIMLVCFTLLTPLC